MTGQTEQTIEELVMQIRNGDPFAPDKLYRKTSENAYALAMQILKNKSLAQRTLQDSYIWAINNLNQLKDPARFQEWFHQIVIHTAKNNSKVKFRTASTKSIHKKVLVAVLVACICASAGAAICLNVRPETVAETKGQPSNEWIYPIYTPFQYNYWRPFHIRLILYSGEHRAPGGVFFVSHKTSP